MPTGQIRPAKKLSAKQTKTGEWIDPEKRPLDLTCDRRDGILRASNLTLSDFNPVYIDNKRVILIEVRHPETQELLGFIRFQSKTAIA